MSAWWSSLGRAQRIVASVVLVVVAVNVVLAALGDAVPSSPGGPTSSSFATAADGLAAYADLLERSGHDVTRLGRRVGPTDLPSGATAVIADPEQLSEAEGAALGRFLDGGGRLVVAGPVTAGIVQAFTGVAVDVDSFDADAEVQVWVPTPYTGAARTIVGDGADRWVGIDGLLPLAGSDGRPTIVTAPVGDGRLLALVDAAPLSNRHLAEGDNATLGLALAGPGRPVVFVESAHGYAEGGLGAVPPGWKWAAAGMLVALVLGLWAAGTRFGPAEPTRRELRPPRSDHVDAVAATMRRGVQHPADLVDPLVDDEGGPQVPGAPEPPPSVSTMADALDVGAAAAERRRHQLDLDPSSPPVAVPSEHPGADQ
ncbi:MAG: DUF4350 domain-containing protein [Actinobacteria bacterium]|nr:DUF4350 domain-containing protein [Actinomycetota bacterium]